MYKLSNQGCCFFVGQIGILHKRLSIIKLKFTQVLHTHNPYSNYCIYVLNDKADAMIIFSWLGLGKKDPCEMSYLKRYFKTVDPATVA